MLVGAMVLTTLAFWGALPARIPTHWNFRGEVDGWSPRWPGAFLVPAIALALWLLLPFLRRVDPRRENYERFDETFYILLNVMIAYMAVIHVLTLGSAVGWPVDVARVMMALIGVTFVALGNFLPRVRSNWWMGIRTPWTLESERVWKETHRVAGWTFVAGGSLAILAQLVVPHPWRVAVSFIGLMAGGLIPVVWSFVLWRRYGD